MFENPRRGRQARNFTKNVPKILALKSSSEHIFSEDCRWVPLLHVSVKIHLPADQNFPGKLADKQYGKSKASVWRNLSTGTAPKTFAV